MNEPARPNPLIDSLVADLSPVRAIRQRDGGLLVLASVALCVVTVIALFGLRTDIVAFAPSGIVIARTAALLLVGIAATAAALTAVRPGVGNRSHGWLWALVAAAALPAAAVLGALNGEARIGNVVSSSVPWCFAVSLSAAALIGGAMTRWLRTGAVTEPKRAAWLVGLAAGAFGTFAYSLYCPSSSIYYAGLWYTLSVGVSAVAGRCIVPGLLRW